MQQLPEALAPLDHYRQFILYKLVPKNDGTGKVDKLPVDPRTLRVFARGIDWQNDPASCTDATTAIELATRLGTDHGVGFLFTERDPFVFIDIDGALANGVWSQVATDLCATFSGSAVEVSQSGSGLHIIGAATSVPAHGCKNGTHGLEMYHTGRFVALTGLHARGNAAHDVTALLPALVEGYFPQSTGGDAVHSEEWTTAPREGYGGPMDDDELIVLMLRTAGGAASVFGNKASIADLWNADPDALCRAYPDDYGSRAYDESKADGALAAHLAFWTGGDCERVERLMWRSGLVRDKWTSNHSYLRNFTITKAVSRCANIYTGKKPAAEPVQAQELPASAEGIKLPFQAAAETFAFMGERDARLIRFNGAWFTRETGGYYRDLDDEIIRAEVRVSCPWQLTPTKVNTTVDELKSALVTDTHNVELPYWLGGGGLMPDARNLIVCKNGILDPSTHQLYEHSDNLLTFNALPFDYDPGADIPIRWLQFLAEVFGNDAESMLELQKLFGYLLTLDTSLQKIFAIIGPKRSGKGTIARVLRELIGSQNVCSPSFNTIGGDFGLAAMIGKQLAVFPDARIGRRTDKAIVAERLLSISGEDALDIGRKHRDDWHGRLHSRMLILSNEVPVFGDASGALASRYVVFHTPHSFYGRENMDLTEQLLDELPGILNWSLEGLQTLRVDGRINTPAVAMELVNEMDSLGSPVKAFIVDACTVGADLMVAKDSLWVAYRKWHEDNGVAGRPMSKEIFARTLKTAYPGQFKDYRPTSADEHGKRPRYWKGVSLTGLAGSVFGAD